jgi:nucleoside-diphosphate-sugar epimerase
MTIPKHNQHTFLVTGGTGFLGSHVVVSLLSRGHQVLVLARECSGRTALQRMDRILDWFGLSKEQRLGLKVLQGDLIRPGLGLDAQDAGIVAGEADEIVHCASDTSFSSRKREQVEKTNVLGLVNLLNVVHKSKCRGFHLISTAYVAGRRSGLCAEGFDQTVGFHNVYEETKFRAEVIVSEYCTRKGLNLHVYRPSIVYGNSNTGRTTLFNALYFPIRTLNFFQKIYVKDILEFGGKKAREMGVRLGNDGVLHMPLRIQSSDECGLNLIPVNHFVEAFMAIRRECPEGGVFHIVNSRRTTISQLAVYTQRFFKLDGIRIAEPDEFIKRPRNGLEILFDNHIRYYSPYMQDKRIFENFRTSAILAGKNIVCPEFSYPVFAICMDYALETDWGRLL